ncbi:hypothetical protein [Mesorhizobium sp. WSM3868]|uniref:hypothetical protein n=1 Tax=Mesorhizobium sp. WSM3868 TaxID=2029405 RepID=UPI000BAE9007|nr:hypothetical protein [Mesorhizobium sp. WSM3868]PBB39612.1 hypothetical protein CK221_01975 [Mesorhizobium sp. WSM3868]
MQHAHLVIKPSQLVMEKCFGKKRQLRPEISAYIGALEHEVLMEGLQRVLLAGELRDVTERHERAVEELAELRATLGAMVRVGLRLKPDEDVLVIKGQRRPLAHESVTIADRDGDIGAV